MISHQVISMKFFIGEWFSVPVSSIKRSDDQCVLSIFYGSLDDQYTVYCPYGIVNIYWQTVFLYMFGIIDNFQLDFKVSSQDVWPKENLCNHYLNIIKAKAKQDLYPKT